MSSLMCFSVSSVCCGVNFIMFTLSVPLIVVVVKSSPLFFGDQTLVSYRENPYTRRKMERLLMEAIHLLHLVCRRIM